MNKRNQLRKVIHKRYYEEEKEIFFFHQWVVEIKHDVYCSLSTLIAVVENSAGEMVRFSENEIIFLTTEKDEDDSLHD